MAPSLFGSTGVILAETTIEDLKGLKQQHQLAPPISGRQVRKPAEKHGTDQNYKWTFVWRNTLAFIYLHSAAIYGLYLMFTTAHASANIFTFLLIVMTGIATTAGAHRLWAHRSYKAKLPLRIVLMLLQTVAFQNHIYEWCRDHRVHHKFTDSDADPHNARRGFFFSHVGWLMIKKHKDVKEKGKTVDLSDLEADPVVRIQRQLYPVIMPLLAFVLPTYFLIFYCGETLMDAWYLTITRWIIQVNATWCVNSAAHIWGTRPYDKRIGPTENRFVEAIAMGEGFHNYHHVFPWDYKAAELAAYKMNPTTAFIDLMAKIGQAYDLKTVSDEMITRRALRTGDGSRLSKEETLKVVEKYINTLDYKREDMIWGWEDKDMKQEEKVEAARFNNLKEV